MGCGRLWGSNHNESEEQNVPSFHKPSPARLGHAHEDGADSGNLIFTSQIAGERKLRGIRSPTRLVYAPRAGHPGCFVTKGWSTRLVDGKIYARDFAQLFRLGDQLRDF
jgi:hypothetical protein